MPVINAVPANEVAALLHQYHKISRCVIVQLILRIATTTLDSILTSQCFVWLIVKGDDEDGN